MNAQQLLPDPDDGAETDGRIAVVGMAGRFPQADSVDALWELLASGTEAVSRFTPEELRASGISDSEFANPRYVPAKGVLDDIDGFDATLFGYGALEASVIDPQQRIFLECAWAALEDAGCDPDRADGPIGVYAGSLLSTYLIHNLLPRTDLRDKLGVPLLFQGNQPDQLAARAAYKLNLRGPAVSVQTACSTSLVAVHLAAQSLLSQECDMALAGGVTVTVPHRSGYLPVEGGIESADGRCKPFGADAAGTVFGNGAGVVVLKRLADALADGDRVHAVILGTAVNNDGAAKAGYTAPSVTGQSAVIREALSVADVAPRSIGYVEGHGTGTPIGDPIEIEALTAAYRAADTEAGTAADGTDAAWCGLGSVKSNLGHLDTAAGITGFIKAVQALRHGRIPASLHAGSADGGTGLKGSPFFVPTGLTDWPVTEGPRRAAVSAFGIGGTNAHVILEQAPEAAARASGGPADIPATEAPSACRIPVALPLSARTATALDSAAAQLADHLAAHPTLPLADVARTLRGGRRRLSHRRVVLARDTAGAVAALRGTDRRESVRARTERSDAPVAFLLPGQAALEPGTAAGLYRAHPVFRDALDECARVLGPHLGRDLTELLRDGGPEHLRRTSVVQPAVVALGHALSRLWAYWGIRPTALLGHSLGEFTAALLSGVVELPDALALAAVRGRLMEETEPGAMLAVPLAEADAAKVAASHGLDLAAVNGPTAAVLSGPAAALERAAATLTERGIRPLRLPVDRAFHSTLCGPAADRFAEELAKVTLHAPGVPFLSGATGDWITAEQATDPAYWARQMLSPVRFQDGLGKLLALDEDLVLVENGPGSVLTDLVRSAGTGAPRLAPPPLPSRGRRSAEDEPASAVLSLAGLWAHGAPAVWEPAGVDAKVTGLPGYPFERLPHWIDPGTAAPAAVQEGPAADAVHARIVWRPLDDGAGVPADPFERRQTWLVLLDAEGSAQPVIDLITARGQIVTVVRPGTEYRRIRRGVYEIDPSDPAQYARLLTDLRGLVRTPTAIVYAWGLGAPAERPGNADGTAGYFGLVRLARALTEASVINEVRLGVVTAGAFRAADGERPDPAAALLSGPVQVLPEEYSNLRCTQADLAPGTRLDPANALEVLRAVVGAPARLLALRDAGLLTRTLEATRPAVTTSPAVPGPGSGSVWVVTGGFGGIGRTLAGHLARTVGARIALLGRHPVTADGEGPAAEFVRELRAAGTELLALQADVSDARSLSAALDRVREGFGGIDGVIHAAGIPGGGSVELRDDDEARAVFGPKTAGFRNLLAALRPGEAGTLLLCSSLATLLPTYGQADYAAANAYLAAAGEAENARGERRVITANWDMWSSVGMASDAEVPADLRALQERMLAGALTPEQGIRAFAALLAGPGGQVAVARAGAEVAADGTLRLSDGPAAARPSATRLPRPELATAYAAPATATEERLAEIYGEMLGIDGVGAHDEFLELGGHSLLAAQVVARLRAEFGVDIPARAFFEGGRVADLAVEIEDLILAELENQ
ncbi:SDR family NAD(P)-dependent oxidoreductase [Streptomyces europaeiscabiei]|uniref:SDR family NAD(P)-dependent oxidoreductase n=1 Tax=Streptomyces europaeiscabiei TaxID=146819 RepID=A0AAJ2PHQ4_9ACTN|nr:SDR family NAD(P)-dependent oxidoreductase [Streptomyces europaeiscabiei]MDX3128262.1 SDR family NAD(P)-dependent oxidoreductase [Streptomyces europaeiscabiei]